MKEIKVTKIIQASQDRVFQVFTDLEKAADHISGITNMEILSEGPVAKGTRWRETRIMFKKEAVEEMEISTFDPPTGYSVEAQSCGCLYHTSFLFEPEGEATRASMTFHAKPLTLVGRIFNFLLGSMMTNTMIKCMEKDMSELQQFIES